MRLGHVAVASAALLCGGCHADVTYRFDFHSNGMVTITGKEIFDDQLYQAALSQKLPPDPFGLNAAAANGWTVRRSTDDNENHVFTLTKDMTVADLRAAGTGVLPNAAGKALAFDPSAFQTTPGIFSDTIDLQTTVPPLVPKTALNALNTFEGAEAEVARTMIRAHLEVRQPGRIEATNSEITPDGYARWDLSLQQPTDIRYRVQVPNVMRIAIAIVCGFAVVVLIAMLLIRTLRPSPASAA